MATINTSINNSPTIVEKVGASVSSVDYAAKAVKYNASGDVVLCSTAGEAALGLALPTVGTVSTGNLADIQIKDMGVWKCGGTVAKGDLLTTDANACCVVATSGNTVLARALEATTTAGTWIKVQLLAPFGV